MEVLTLRSARFGSNFSPLQFSVLLLPSGLQCDFRSVATITIADEVRDSLKLLLLANLCLPSSVQSRSYRHNHLNQKDHFCLGLGFVNFNHQALSFSYGGLLGLGRSHLLGVITTKQEFRLELEHAYLQQKERLGSIRFGN